MGGADYTAPTDTRHAEDGMQNTLFIALREIALSACMDTKGTEMCHGTTATMRAIMQCQRKPMYHEVIVRIRPFTQACSHTL